MVKSQRTPYKRLLTTLIVISFVGVGIALIISVVFLLPNKYKQQRLQRQSNLGGIHVTY